MRRLRKQLFLALGLSMGLGLTACAKAPNYVKTQATLGKVVVYRNGVAYFERRARLEGNELRLSVPRDKVDDFLKSLTVSDAETGKSLPVSFPRKGTESGEVVDMVVRLPVGTSSEVILTYITDSPAWKPSYRLVVDEAGNVELEGWAIVDNTSGEPWKDVLVGVGSSSALSFRYDLWSIRDVHRQILNTEESFAVAPPQGASTYAATSDKGAELISDFSDEDINMPATHPDRAEPEPMPVSEAESVAMTDASTGYGDLGGAAMGRGGMGLGQTSKGRAVSSSERKKAMDAARVAEAKRRRDREVQKRREQKNQRQVRSLATKLKKEKSKVVIEGYASMDDTAKDSRALDRANVLRNQLIQEGVAPAQIEVRSGGAKEGRPAGVRLIAKAPTASQEKGGPDQDADPVGESHFQSASPMSVQQNASVMVSIVKDDTPGNIVYLYDAESSRGNNRFAFKAVRFKNPTANTLEAGPVTVYGQSRFVGEGLTDPIPPAAMAMVPFALDRQIVIDHDVGRRDKIARLVKLERGVLTTEVQHVRTTKLSIKNRQSKAATVYVRHTVLDGWDLLDAPDNVEMLGSAHLFPVTLKGGEMRDMVIEEATPMTKTLDLRSRASLDIVQLYLSSEPADPEFAKHMKELLDLHHRMANHKQAITSLRERMVDYRKRMDELHVQIVSLKVVKSGGALMKNLKEKMEDISDRVQQSTIEVVEHQEQEMLARIQFQDAVAELSLEGLEKTISKAK